MPPWILFNRICSGWKSFNTRTIESYPASRGTFLHTTCRGFCYSGTKSLTDFKSSRPIFSV
ncbi:hypothetical protein COD27_25985 [Escherichia coli]|nr:hypothetical protein COD27_25985 [Escherichia coli]